MGARNKNIKSDQNQSTSSPVMWRRSLKITLL